MARHAYDLYSRDAKFLDLQDFELPICDGNTCYEDLAVKKLKEIISNAKSIILASPIYNYDFNAAAKNLIELTGGSWNEKIVGFISSAGGMNSFMSPISFANIMMIDFRCIIIPRYVYADKKCFSENDEINNEIKERIEKLVEKSIFLTNSLL
tara:strand:- start:143 stop:601 length:459 start_codon:yes stop_codon:yes gene_type:complete